MLDSGRLGPAVLRWSLAAVIFVSTVGFAACGGKDFATPQSVPKDAVAVVGEVPIMKQAFERRFESQTRGMAGFFDSTQSGRILDAPGFQRCVTLLRKDMLRSRRSAGLKSAVRPTAAQLRQNCRLQYDQLKQRTISQLITEQWHIQVVRDLDLDLTDKAIAARLNDYADRLAVGKGRSRARFKLRMKRAGLKREDLVAELRARLAQQAWEAVNQVRPELGGDDIKRYYEQHPSRFGRAAERTVEIISTDDEQSAEDAASRVEKGEGVASVSAEVSSDLNIRGADGVLKIQQGESTLPAAVESEIFAAGKGDVNGPVQADGKWYLYRVVGSTEADVPPFEKVEDLARELATAAAAQRNTVEVVNGFRDDWRDQTLCAPGHLVPECSNGPEMQPVPLP